MLAKLFNSEVAAAVLLYLYRHDEAYVTAMARDKHLTLSAVQKQLTRFEHAGLLTFRLVGKTKLYAFNRQNRYTEPLIALLQVTGKPATVPKRREQTVSTPSKTKPQLPAEPAADEELWRY